MSSRVPQPSTKRLDENYRNQGSPVEADITTKPGRTQKQTDILIFDRIGSTRKINDNGLAEGMLFRGASHKALAGLSASAVSDQLNIMKTWSVDA